MKTKIGKKSIGILIAAIIVTSVFAAISITPLIASESRSDGDVKPMDGDVKPMDTVTLDVNPGNDSAIVDNVTYWLNFTTSNKKVIPQYGILKVYFEAGDGCGYDRAGFVLDDVEEATDVSLRVAGTDWTYNTDYTATVDAAGCTIYINVTNATGILNLTDVEIDIKDVQNSGAGYQKISVWTYPDKYCLPSEMIDVGYDEFCIYTHITNPTDGACLGGDELNLTWIDNPGNCGWEWSLHKNESGVWKKKDGGNVYTHFSSPIIYEIIDITSCDDGEYKFEVCPPGGGGACLCGAEVIFMLDRTPPTLNWEYPLNDTWFNCTQEINWNVTAEDLWGCGIDIKNVTLNLTEKANTTAGKWPPPLTKILKLGPTGIGNFFDFDSKYSTYSPFDVDWLQEFQMQALEVTASDLGGNLANDTVFIGVDCTDPGKTGDPSCNEEEGKIVIEWTAASDALSGIDYYNVYGKHLNDSTTGGGWSKGDTFWAGRTIGPELIFNYTRGCPESETYSYYQFNITAVDKAGNEGPFSNYTVEEQQLRPGKPALIDITLKDDFLHASGQKEGDFIKANVTDIDGLAVADVKVKFNATLGMPCPPQNITEGDGLTYSAYHAPQSVLEPTITKICGWVAENTSIAKCVNLTLLPQQPTSINCTANPTKIDANQTTTNSTIVVQLMSNEGEDGEDHPVYGHVFVTLTTTAGTLDRTSGYTNDTGAFIANLSSTVHPAIATVTAYAGGTGPTTYLWKDSCTVAFIGPVTEFSIELYKGRNDISIPLWPEDSSCNAVFAGLGTNVNSVWHYDAENDEWAGWMHGCPPPPDECLTEIIPGEGYQVEMHAPATLTITGKFIDDDHLVPPVYKVVKGWNMIGFHSLNEKITPEEYIAGRGPAYTVTGIEYQEPLWSFHKGFRSTGSTIEGGGAGHSNYDEHFMKPGWGYWIYITNEGGVIIPHWE